MSRYVRRSVQLLGIVLVVFIGMALGHFFLFGPKDMSPEEGDETIPWWTVTSGRRLSYVEPS